MDADGRMADGSHEDRMVLSRNDEDVGSVEDDVDGVASNDGRAQRRTFKVEISTIWICEYIDTNHQTQTRTTSWI